MKLLEAIDTHGIDVLDHLDRDADIPVVDGLAFQGDVAIIPAKPAKGEPIPVEGVPVVRGENGGNTHLLIGGGTFAPATARGLSLGTVVVPDGAVTVLAHPEHGYLQLAPGAYELRRQREQADEIRVVAD